MIQDCVEDSTNYDSFSANSKLIILKITEYFSKTCYVTNDSILLLLLQDDMFPRMVKHAEEHNIITKEESDIVLSEFSIGKL
jgi:hypothetical protein